MRRIPLPFDDDADALAHEVERNLATFRTPDVSGSTPARRFIERVARAGLERRVAGGEPQNARRGCPFRVVRTFELDEPFGQRSGLVGAQDSMLPRFSIALRRRTMTPVRGHHLRAAREVDAEDRRQSSGLSPTASATKQQRFDRRPPGQHVRREDQETSTSIAIVIR